jgi:hypothetical protein
MNNFLCGYQRFKYIGFKKKKKKKRKCWFCADSFFVYRSTLLQHHVHESITRASALGRQVASPLTPQGFHSIRRKLGFLLFDICTCRGTNASRRSFQTAVVILDYMMITPTFIPRVMRSERDLMKLCLGLACVASKLCDSDKALRPETACDIFPDLDSTITYSDIVDAELDVLGALNWHTWFVTPYDVASPASIEHEDFCHLRDYIVDLMCCNGDSCGLTPYVIDCIASNAAVDILQRKEATASMSVVATTPLQKYYASPKRRTVSITHILTQ